MQQQNESPTVDVVIPTYRPDDKFYRLLDSLQQQTIPVSHVWIVNTVASVSSDLGEELRARCGEWVSVTNIPVESFDHGSARNLGASFSSADYLLFMTQDAVPADEKLVEFLLSSFVDTQVAVAYARQLPADNADVLERLARDFNYPSQSQTKSKCDIERLGIKTYFCSNVCALYSKHIFEKLARFPEGMIFNEDMIYASTAIQAGYSIRYQAEAQVVHSHNYGLKKLFGRYFDLGVSQRQNRSLFDSLPSAKEGGRFVRWTIDQLGEQGEWLETVRFFFQSGTKYLGYILGKHYDYIPLACCKRMSSFPSYWDNFLNDKK